MQSTRKSMGVRLFAFTIWCNHGRVHHQEASRSNGKVMCLTSWTRQRIWRKDIKDEVSINRPQYQSVTDVMSSNTWDKTLVRQYIKNTMTKKSFKTAMPTYQWSAKLEQLTWMPVLLTPPSCRVNRMLQQMWRHSRMQAKMLLSTFQARSSSWKKSNE